MPSIAASKPPLPGVTRAVLARGPSARMRELSRDQEEPARRAIQGAPANSFDRAM